MALQLRCNERRPECNHSGYFISISDLIKQRRQRGPRVLTAEAVNELY